jgi:hypothetical protein
VREMRNTYKSAVCNPDDKRQHGRSRHTLYGRIMCKLTLKEEDMRMQTGFISLRIESIELL